MSDNKLTYQTQPGSPNIAGSLLNMAVQGILSGADKFATTGANAGLSGLGQAGQFFSGIGNQFASGYSDVLGAAGDVGDFFAGMFSEGGISTQPIEVVKLRSGHRDYNVKHYAEGTHNTNGGMPAILHPNEAVIPLSRGREVPVKMTGHGAGSGVVVNVKNTFNTPNPDAFRASSGSINNAQSKAMKRAALRNLSGAN
jgi:hypothetical protein